MIYAVIGAPAFDLGYAFGSIFGAFALGFVLTFTWGVVRADDDRLRRGLDWAWHWRSLSVAGFLWLASAIGRLGA